MSTSNEGRNVKMLFRILKKDLKRKSNERNIALFYSAGNDVRSERN